MPMSLDARGKAHARARLSRTSGCERAGGRTTGVYRSGPWWLARLAIRRMALFSGDDLWHSPQLLHRRSSLHRPADLPSGTLEFDRDALFGAGELKTRNPDGIERASHDHAQRNETRANEQMSDHRCLFCPGSTRSAVSRALGGHRFNPLGTRRCITPGPKLSTARRRSAHSARPLRSSEIMNKAKQPKRPSADASARMTTAEATVAALIAHGIDTIYALPGVHNDSFFDALFKAADHIRVVHTRHEQGAAYLALGAALATGKPQVYSVVPGPGLLNSAAALLTAYGMNAPVLALI